MSCISNLKRVLSLDMVDFFAFLPQLKNEAGHIHSYNLMVHKSVLKNGWNYLALLPQSCQIKQFPFKVRTLFLPNDWEKDKGLIQKLITPLFNFSRLKSFFNAHCEKESVFFLESFLPGHFFAFACALLFSKAKPILYLVHRYSPFDKKYFVVYRLYALIHWFLEKKVTKLVLFTDTDILVKEQEKVFKRSVKLLPIPTALEEKQKLDASEPLFWWPGASVRKDKGLQAIRKIATELKGAKLVVAESARNYFKSDHQIIFLPVRMSKEAYDAWFQKAHLVLLPYVPRLYRGRSSGIFVEAVCAGAIPVTSRGTWMAQELRRFGLEALLVDWNDPQLMERLKKISSAEEIKKKLDSMKEIYRQRHSITSYANCLNQYIN